MKKAMKTKVLTATVAWLLASMAVHAQNTNMEAIPLKPIGYDIYDIHNMMQQHDGDIITNVIVATSDDPHGYNPTILGHVVYKLSPETLQFSDSLFLPDSVPPIYLYAKDPRSEGNIRANIEIDGEGNSQLRISRFTDGDLHVNHDLDVVVPLCDGVAYDEMYSQFMDCQGNLIIKYYKEPSPDQIEGHIVRVDVEGNLLCEAPIPESQNFVRTMDVFSESPLEYYEWRAGSGSHLNIYLMDSTFQLKNTYIINKMIGEDPETHIQEYFEFYSSNSNSTFVVPDGEDVLVASRYMNTMGESGVAAARYNLRTMQRKALVQFNDYLGMDGTAKCFGFQKMPDGTVYMVYSENGMPAKYWMTVVKMDSNLNVDWKRYYEAMEDDPYGTFLSIPLEDEEGCMNGFACTGVNTGGVFFLFLNHDGIPASVGGGIEVRPYMSYPNPAQDQLHLQYSPDVQPKQVELYDLQGRLVRSQGNTFETVDMGQLPAGTYTLRVTMQDGQTFSDKVVKE